MTRKEADTSWVEMDRLSRIFTWLTAAIVTFMLGMLFGQVIFADTTTALATFQQSGVPFTVSYPAGWSAGFDRQHDLVTQSASVVAGASDSMLVLNDRPITQMTGVGDTYLVTLGKIRPDKRAPFEALLTNPTAKVITITGTSKAVEKTGLILNGGIKTEVVMIVGSDLYAMELMTTRGATDVSKDAATILASLKFTN